jgi:histidinol-phosphate phosphatase family domain/HAD-superfamily hydrolase, subfamily IIIA
MNESQPRKYVLLDRDGTIMIDKGYQKDPALTELFPNALEGMKTLYDAGYGLVMVTNQSGIGRGYLSAADLEAVNASLGKIMAAEGVKFDGIYFCPHVPGDNCDCRKPQPGMVSQATRELHFDPRDAVVVGDRDCDIELGIASGTRTVLVRTGGGLETERKHRSNPDYTADDLMDAARWIIANI